MMLLSSMSTLSLRKREWKPCHTFQNRCWVNHTGLIFWRRWDGYQVILTVNGSGGTISLCTKMLHNMFLGYEVPQSLQAVFHVLTKNYEGIKSSETTKIMSSVTKQPNLLRRASHSSGVKFAKCTRCEAPLHCKRNKKRCLMLSLV